LGEGIDMRRVYLDHAATTPLDREVLEAMLPYFSEKFGNPSSLHSFGIEAHEAIETSREKVADLIGAKDNEIIFTSGGTESDNLALRGIAYLNREKLKEEGPHIITSCIVISIMFANNEIGTIEPIEEIGKIAREHNILFHTDAVQAVGKINVDVKKLPVDLLSISAHKIYGPKGVGALFVREGVKLKSIQTGGGHEGGIRSGTENVPGIVGLGEACRLAKIRMEDDNSRIKKLRDRLIKGILDSVEESYLNGHPEKRLPNNAHFRFTAIEGESLILFLDQKGIAASTGSACSSKKLKPSHVLLAIGLSPVEAHGSLRLTLGRENTEEDVDYVLEVLPEVIGKLREISPLWRNNNVHVQ